MWAKVQDPPFGDRRSGLASATGVTVGCLAWGLAKAGGGELAIWFSVLSGAAAAAPGRIRRGSFRRRMEQVSGLVLLGFAAELAIDRS